MKSGTSHEDWVSNAGGYFRKVTVDCPKAPFSQDLISSMARQAGVNKKIRRNLATRVSCGARARRRKVRGYLGQAQ